MPQNLPLFTQDCCRPSSSRRSFLKSTAAMVGLVAVPHSRVYEILADPDGPQSSPSETLVTTLYSSLNERQRSMVCMPFDHELQSVVKNNWHITEARVGDDFTADQQEMIRQIFLGIHSPEYAEAVLKQVAWDTEEKGLQDCSIALFGEPGQGKFEFVLSGRHVTRRCDGNSVQGAAFGGPIFYGHQASPSATESPKHEGNVYWYQAQRANEVFAMLNGKQRELALLGDARREQATATVKLTGKKSGLPGIPVSELWSDQKRQVRKVLEDVLAPFRKVDSDEAMNLIEQSGFEHLHLAFYKNQDLGNDGVWDVWQIEGPSSLIFFRGEPHVHAYIHIRETA